LIEIRRSQDRGHAVHGWLDTHHSFSFADYYDPRFMGYRALRVINEDRVQAGAGFPPHPHRDMEILTWLLAGRLEHKDSMGHGSVLRVGELQRMSAGSGVMHSEFNASQSEPVHLLQIWIQPERAGGAPSYEQKVFPEAARRGRLQLLASREGRGDSLRIGQDVDLYASWLERGGALAHDLRPGRGAWLQLARGALCVEGAELVAGDGAAIEAQPQLAIEALEPSELLLFDLA
jgi:redox-sensitive bicupin YhaK (pirin superfamily)